MAGMAGPSSPNARLGGISSPYTGAGRFGQGGLPQDYDPYATNGGAWVETHRVIEQDSVPCSEGMTLHDKLIQAPSRVSPLRRGGPFDATGNGSRALPDGGNDPIQAALSRISDDFPIVHSFQRINYGFYRVEGKGTCELSLARNSDKLLCKMDTWNRGVRGELTKFLQTIGHPSSPMYSGQISRTPSEKSLPRGAVASNGGTSVVSTTSANTAASRIPKAASHYRPPERGISRNAAADGPAVGQVPPGSPNLRRSPVRKAPGPMPKQPGAKSAGHSAGIPAGSRKGSQLATPRKDSIGPSAGTPGTPLAMASRYREGALYVHAQEPLFGDPMVMLRAADPRLDGYESGGDFRVLVRLLCSGRVAEVRASYITPLELRPRSSSLATLNAFEEVFLLGGEDDGISLASGQSIFSTIELQDLSSAELALAISTCWPADSAVPLRGLIWVLRPFFVDWLKRRQRLRMFTQLAIALPEEALHREVFQGGSTDPCASTLVDLLADITERDLLAATLLATPPEQRSQLFGLAAEVGQALPLAFPSIRCPCPPVEPEVLNAMMDASGSYSLPPVDRGVCVHWDAFESLLARPADRPLLLSIGAQGCAQCGKSTLLKELLGLEATIVDALPAHAGMRGAPQQAQQVFCRSPAHAPGADLLKSPPPLSWTADVHGCAFGDPAWMALVATFTSTASLVLLHVSAEDFNIQLEEDPPRHPPPQAVPGTRRGTLDPRGAGLRRGSASVPSSPAVPLEQSYMSGGGNPRVTAKPDLLTLMRICVDARLTGAGSSQVRVVVILRDAAVRPDVVSAIRLCMENVLGPALGRFLAMDRLSGLAGAYRQRSLAPVRAAVQYELDTLAEGASLGGGASLLSTAGGVGSHVVPFPCIETCKRIYGHFYDRLTLAGERPVLASAETTQQSRTGELLASLLDDAEVQAQGNLCSAVFPVSEAASRLARLKAEEKRMLDSVDGKVPDDAQIASLSAKLREVDKNRKELLAQPLSMPVRFFVEAVLAEPRLRYARCAEFGQYLTAWRNPRMTPLMERRRSLLDERLELSQEMRRAETAAEGAQGHGNGHHPKEEAKLKALEESLAEAENSLEQLNVNLDCFWAELAAISDLSTELQGLGIRMPPELPDAGKLKQLFGEWAWNLGCPVQLLHGSPLQCAGQFLVEVLKDLGQDAASSRELFVISVIGIQSSAKSTLLNYLFGCGFATSAGRCTRGLYCSLMECDGRMLLLMDTEGLMSLEAAGGDVFDAQLALMAMACSHLVLINHKGELSRQLQDLLEVCLFAMQHLKVCRIQPRILFVLRDQHDRSQSVHGDALRLMRKHLAEASSHLSLRLDELISLDPGSVFLLPSAFASDLDPSTGKETRWSTELFAQEVLRLRRKIFVEGGGCCLASGAGDGADTAPEFSTLPDWCLHTMSVWRVLDRYGPNLLHYKTIQEIELQRELEDLVKQISAQMVTGKDGLAESAKVLLSECTHRLGDGEPSEQVDAEFRSSLGALLERCAKRSQAELDRCLQVRKSKLPDASKAEAKRKLQLPVEYQGDLTRYTWALCLTEAVDRDQLRALKVHFKKTIEDLWQSSNTIADEQARRIFAHEWAAFEEKCRERFERTTKNQRQLAEEVCMVFNHALRQHRHGDEKLHVLEMLPANALLNTEPLMAWDNSRIAREFFEVRQPVRLAEYAAQRSGDPRRPAPVLVAATTEQRLEALVVPEVRKRLGPVLTFELQDGSAQMPPEEALLESMRRLNEAVEVEEGRFLAQLGVRFRGGRVEFLNAAHRTLRYSILSGLVRAEAQRCEHQWSSLQSHRHHTEMEFLAMVQKRTTDAGRAKMLADMFFDALAREWLDETLVAVAADIRSQCLADMPDASGAAERAYQQAFVERNWQEVLEYVLDVNAYLHKIFAALFEDRKTSITRVQRPQLVAQLGSLFDSVSSAMQRWGNRGPTRSKLSTFQVFLREQAADAASRAAAPTAASASPWSLLSERFPVVADFDIEDPPRFAHEFSLQVAARLGEARVEALVSERLEAALHKQQAQVWALVRGCSAMCPCCGSKCDRTDSHTMHNCSHHLFPAFNGWRVAGTCEAALDACKSSKNHEAPKRSDYTDHLFPNLEEYLKAEHPEWLPFPREDRELLADSVLKAAWVNCRAPLLCRYDMVDSTPAEWLAAYEEPHRKLRPDAIDKAEAVLTRFGYDPGAA